MDKTGSQFEENMTLLLTEKKFEDVLELLTNPENHSLVSENVWNLIYLVCRTVKSESLLQNDTDVTRCKAILMFLVGKGRPKEVLMSLLEQADSFKDHEFFCLLLDPLKYTLEKVPGKRGKSLQWVLSTLNAHVETLDAPEDLDLQGEEKLLLDTDPAVQDTTYILSHYLSFIEFFVDEVSFENVKKNNICYIDRIYQQQKILHRYILKLFYKPLLYHDLHVVSQSRPKSTICVLCENCVTLLSKICRNVFNLFQYDDLSKNKNYDSLDSSLNEDDSVLSLAFANFSYLIFVENLALGFQPFVYSHLHVFMKNLKYIILLLKAKENLILFKGLHLAKTLLNNLESSELNYDCVELEVFTEFPKLLLDVAIFCKIEVHRKSSIQIFTTYMSKCNSKGRYHLIMQVLTSVKHSGAQGLVINFYKNFLHDALAGNELECYFLGKNLRSFLKSVFVLTEGVETDILENSDKIITSINFLRYLLLRDPKEKNFTGIWDLISFISKNFCTPLTTALDFSRAHYKQALKDAENEKKEQKSMNMTVSVNREILPNVPVNFQKDVYHKALVTFDVIDSLLSRVNELL